MSADLQQTIFSLIKKILLEQSVAPTDMTLESRIGDLGMTSMGLAELVSALEQIYGVDPFDDEISITDIVTVRDLVFAYKRYVHA